ncbi:MAG: lectin MOA-related protein [Chloroflexi bacterium]|nr:lectin MOA-related protein [Chloroflexota bacterium]
MKELINWLLKLMAERLPPPAPPPPPAPYDLLEIPAAALATMLDDKEIEFYFFDSKIVYPSHERWGELFWDVLSNIDPWSEEYWDCDDISLLVKSRFAERYRINGIGIGIGMAPEGYHAYNIFLSEKGLFILEPQTGEVWPVTSKSKYKTDWVIW